MEPGRQSKVLKWSVIIGIIIVLNLFFNYAISLVYPAPDYNVFCPQSQIVNPPENQTGCLKAGGQWTVYPASAVPTPATTITPVTPTNSVANSPASVKSVPMIPATSQPTGYCDATYTCGNNYTTAMNLYDRNIFIALVSLGVISILVGLFWRTTDAVSVGLSFGGVVSLIIGSGRYWSEAGNILKVVILAVALVALIWVGVRKFKDKE
jgi:hypothetical protein